MQIEGRNTVVELLRSKKHVEKIFLQKGLGKDEKIDEILKKARGRGIRIFSRSKKELDRKSYTKAHQGVIAVTKNQHESNFDEVYDESIRKNKSIKLIYIREAFHEYNIGAIIRTAETAGFSAVVLPPKISLNANIIRASMGATEHIKVINEALFPLIKQLHNLNFKVYGIERTTESINYNEADYEGDVMLIIGGEDKSLSDSILKKCDATLQIPMKGKVNSLNMSVAAAIVVFEVLRQNDLT